MQLGGEWAHVDQVPYLAGDNPALAKYAELREKLAAKRFPRLTTAQLAREYPLETPIVQSHRGRQNAQFSHHGDAVGPRRNDRDSSH